MPTLLLNGRHVDVDIRYELEQFEWTRPTWTEDRLLAASPFRYDRTPSFYVYLEDTASAKAGYWGDSGAYDAEFARGGFVKLLAFLRAETEDETVDYLLETYAPTAKDGRLTLRLPKLKAVAKPEPLPESLLADDRIGPNDYLTGRGIEAEVQREAGVGLVGNAVAIPWRLPNGRLANVKYRSTRGKAFWYVKGGWPIRDLVYGMDLVYAKRLRHAVICEAEIDAMAWRSVGVPAIGTGGSAFNLKKADIITQSPVEYLTVVTDNDKAGDKLRAAIERYLNGKVRLAHGYITEVKDANELLVKRGAEALRNVYDRAEGVRPALRVGSGISELQVGRRI
ncbi:toprim domain-containing protein [Bacillus subtilis]|uniref:toprim domain-containing protein n=1 Tax=Bacillus subtilis TaxID=1423 RepID=UPI002DB5D39F|nr:toprim domain-containing protein [Bacillus subtilis]MEC1007988.1 toprim domain-containing protein [Bacillus subtilis]MEC1072790.1 toprim domain-containing protein [Bacillus subtilis]